MVQKTFYYTFLFLSIVACSGRTNNDLSGEWTYRLDIKNVGATEHWYNQKFKQVIQLPGSLRENNIGNDPSLTTQWTGSIYDSSWFFNPAMEEYRQEGNMKFPFWLTPDKHFIGAAWYQKEIVIPKTKENKDVQIVLERPHWQTTVWIDSVLVGEQNSLSVPHYFTINTNRFEPGIHTLTIRVDNEIHGIDPGINSHSISDHTQGNWNGITGKIYYSISNQSRIKLVRIQPDLESNSVKAKLFLDGLDSDSRYSIGIKTEGLNHKHTLAPINKEISSSDIDIEIPMGNDYKTWSEFSPNLYKIEFSLLKESELVDSCTETFGMRDFSINEKHFEINGTPIFLRGTTECCVFPLTGYPPTIEEEWARIFDKCSEYGLNHMRFHSYCPPEAAFVAADKAGFYLQVEGPSWAKYSTGLGYGKPIDKYLMEETKRIIDEYGNHPSFCMMAYGNEPSGRYVGYLENWVDHFRKYDPQRVFTGASTGRSWAIIDNSDFIVRSPPRGLQWKSKQPQNEFDYRNKTENQERPYVTFEMGQWCVFPNFNEIDKYTGPLKAKNFELFQNELSKNHMGDQAEDFLFASGKLQASCYKQEIEATLRTPNLAGFQLLSLNDFSGQGTALVGVLDAFWDDKGYIDGKEFRSFCSEVVPLVRMPKYTYSNTDTLIAIFETANFSGSVLEDMYTTWSIKDSKNQLIDSGQFSVQDIALGNCNTVGKIDYSLNNIKTAQKLTLKFSVGKYSNHWNFWVYPSSAPGDETTDIHICDTLDKKALKVLEGGGKVLLLASGKVENGKEIVQYLTPVFWNTSWFRMRPPHTTGILVDAEHSVFNHFPTDTYSDLQWWEIANRQQAMNLENFPAEFKSIVQPIDTWFLNRRLSMLFEAKVLNGNLIVCSIDINSELQERIVAKQLRSSIIQYMVSNKFQPKSELNPDVILELFEHKERATWNSYVTTNP